MIDFLAMEPHFLAHLAPVWHALPEKGRFLVEPRLLAHAAELGIEAESSERPPRVPAYPEPRFDGPRLVVASYGDLKVGRRLGYGPFALLQHGAGQSYGDQVSVVSGSYSGGPDHADVTLHLVPNQHSADRWQRAYPDARVELVGCPRLDSLPKREHEDSTGLQCDLWRDLLAAIQSPQTTPARVPGRRGGLCVAHAITDMSATEPNARSSRVIAPSLSTTGSDISSVDQMPLNDQRIRVQEVTAALTLAMSTCIGGLARSCLGSATSAGQSSDLRWLSDGTLQKSFGGSIHGKGPHILRIRTTTFGSVSLAIPCTTIKAGRFADKVVCVTFHWSTPMSLGPEAQTALGEYIPVLSDLAAAFNVIGHAHPKGDWPERMKRIYARAGIPFVADFDEVCRRADLLIFDNTSAGFEFAATGRPVVVLNSRYYRRNVDHGLRFWEAASVGMQVDRPADLVETVRAALDDPVAAQTAREAALGIVYAYRSGAAQRAAQAIGDWLAD